MLSLTGIETAAARVVGRIVTRRTSKALETWHLVASLYDTRPAMPTATADALLASLSSTETAGLGHYLESPEIEQQALQLLVTARSGSRRWADNVQVAVRGEVRESLRLSGITPDNLLPVTDLVLDALRVACHEGAVSDLAEPRFLATASHVAATATRNGRLLSRLGTLTAVHELADRMRGQVAALHAEMRLPHTGASRSVPWSELYVEPVLEPGHRQEPAELTEPGRRTVILGDPGAGKSTLVHKLAYDTALLPGGPAPFLLTLRDLPDITVRKARLADHLRELWREPYNLEPSPEDVEYLLLNGRAVVILDGLDELTDIARRRRVTQLVEAFVALFPLVPMIVTSRRIGYHEVPLSDRLFHTRTIEPFNDERVESYATHWFRLDDATPPAQRDRLRDLFLAETVAIDDLRSNPLLLALLCAMYATEQYIPRNRAQVYEKCALMVFDRWDSMRGIPLAVQFQGHVRGAVQELAWQMFAVSDVSELPRYKVLRIITRYLVAKGFDDADSERLAEKFLGFCAGRAWVLAEVGATETEPVYGFAHRTFLEYFTAEHLVRHHPEPGSLWEVLADKLDSGTWEVVAQLAVQLLERNRDNGATELLDHPLKLLEASGTTMDLNLAGFVARATGEVSLPPTTLDRIVAVALSAMRAVRIKDRVTLESD